MATLEILCGIRTGIATATEGTENVARVIIRVFTTALIVLLAIIFPAFDRIMAFLGSFLCFTICIILPLAFYLKIFGEKISRSERILDWVLLIVSSILAVIGTVWAFLPSEVISGN